MARIVFGPPVPRPAGEHAMARLAAFPPQQFGLSVMEPLQDAADRLSGGDGLALLTRSDGKGKVFVNRATVLWVTEDED